MDTCQPIYISIKDSPQKPYFLLIIQDEKLFNQKDPEPFYYVFNWGILSNVKYFKNPEEAYKHAMELFPKKNEIEKITSMYMNDFLSEDWLKVN